MRILVIDDDELSRLVATETLESAGHYVTELPSPIGATRVILQENIDLVVLDVMMPSLNGDKLAKLIRGNRQMERVQVVLMSASEDQRMYALAKSVGAMAFVGKSQMRAGLLKAIGPKNGTKNGSKRPEAQAWADEPIADEV